ncbi:unnamed protein product, partial [Effrenium voratum]
CPGSNVVPRVFVAPLLLRASALKVAMSEGGRWLCNEQCFAGVLATTLTASAQLLAKVRETVKKHSIPEDQAARAWPAKDLDLRGEARCSGPRCEGRCALRLCSDVLLIKPGEDGQEKLQLLGAEVECQGAVVTLSRPSGTMITMVFDSEKLAGQWATKLAVACGHSDSIAKLFSTQRRRIATLEQRTKEAQMSNEEVERCLNFLSREYVEMRYQVRKGPTAAQSAQSNQPENAAPVSSVKEEEEPMLVEDVEAVLPEPEKEPLLSARESAKEDRRSPSSVSGRPKVVSPRVDLQDRTPVLEGLDRRGHKLAMAGQRRAPGAGGADKSAARRRAERPERG